MRIILDPDGLVVLEFDTFEDRASFVKFRVPKGPVFNAMRPSTEWPRLTWKLTDLKSVTVLDVEENDWGNPFYLDPRGG